MQLTVQNDDEKGISDGSFLRRQAAQEIGEVFKVVKLVSKKKVSTYSERGELLVVTVQYTALTM
jgi:hypothetical protein